MKSKFKVIHRPNYHETWGVQEKDCDPFFKGDYLFTSTDENEAIGVAKFLDRHPEVIYSDSFA